MHNYYIKLMAVCRVRNLDNLKTNIYLRSNKIYTKNVNTKFINCKANRIASNCTYYKTLLPPQAQHENL